MRKEKVVFLGLLLSLVLAGCSTAGPGGEEQTSGGQQATRQAAPKPQPIVVPAGTAMDVRLNSGLSSEDNQAGDPFTGELDNAVVVGDKVVFPKGADVSGKVTKAVKSGRLKERAELWVTVDSISMHGQSYNIATSTEGHKEGSKTTRNILFIGGGAGGGAAIGGATGGGKGAAIGSAIGAGAGLAGAMLTGKRDVKFPPETVLRFTLEQEIRVTP